MRPVLRFYRWLETLRLWQQFTLLGLFVITLPILLITWQFLSSGQAILTEHEIIDLSEESNLRVTDIREDFAALRRDLAQKSHDLNSQLLAEHQEPTPLSDYVPQTRATLQTLMQEWNRSGPIIGRQPDTVLTVRRRYFPQSLMIACGFSITAESKPGKMIAAVGPDGNDISNFSLNDNSAISRCLSDLTQNVARDAPGSVSHLHLEKISDTKSRCLIAVGWPTRWVDGVPTELLAVVVDFTHYIGNRTRASPRHYYIVTDPQGRLLIHPVPGLVESGANVQEVTHWEFPDHAFEQPGESSDEQDRRLARVLREGGVRLPGVVIPNLAAYYRKGFFNGNISQRLGEGHEKQLYHLNMLLITEANQHPEFRFAEIKPTSSYVELAHPDKNELLRICTVVEEWRKRELPQDDDIDWIDPLPCKTFQGQLTHLHIDSNDQTEPARLIVAASLEELHEDIDTRFERIVWRMVLPTFATALILTLSLIVVLTRTLQRLANAAEHFTDVDTKIPLRGGGCLEVTQLANSFRHLTKRLRDDAARYQTILRAAGEGIIVTDSQGRIEEANRAAARMFRFSQPEEMVSIAVWSLLDQPDHPEVKATQASIQQRGQANTSLTGSLVGRCVDGHTFWLEVTLGAVELRDRRIITFVFRDISHRKAAEDQIKQLNEDLESRVRLRTTELAETNTKLEVALRQAEAASQAKDTFVANMSHELRQPLHIVIGFTEALKEEAEDTQQNHLIPDLNKILTAARHLLDLINDILDLAKISSGRMELSIKPFDLKTLIDEVRTLVLPLAQKNDNRFQVEIVEPMPSQAISDERRIRQILLNLLSNAFKFTRNGDVYLTVKLITSNNQTWIEFTIRDTGKGMSSEQLAGLFDRFYQVDPSTTREQGGTGLGLAISRSFNDLLGGQPIEVHSQPGIGSEFVVRLPTMHQHSFNEEPNSEFDDSGEPLMLAHGTVLVIDDDPMVQELMARFLRKEGYRVVIAESGADGLRLARELHPVAITLDVMMPGVDGWNVLSDLKADPKTCEIPVIMLTIVDDHGRGYTLGASDYLTKPVDWPRLGAILRKFQLQDRDRPVLVVDDDPECRAVIRRYLTKDGWRMTEAGDGQAALDAVEAETPSLILLDLMMPGVDGFGFLDEFPKRFPGLRTPIIILTAKELTAADFDRLNGRVARILEKGNLTYLETIMQRIREQTGQGGPITIEPTEKDSDADLANR